MNNTIVIANNDLELSVLQCKVLFMIILRFTNLTFLNLRTAKLRKHAKPCIAHGRPREWPSCSRLGGPQTVRVNS